MDTLSKTHITLSVFVQEEVEELEFLHKQPVVARGMAATLSLLRNTGTMHTHQHAHLQTDRQTLVCLYIHRYLH